MRLTGRRVSSAVFESIVKSFALLGGEGHALVFNYEYPFP